MMTILGTAEFGVTTFFTRSHPNDKCGANGLPLTPNSIKVLGRFQVLKTLDHPRICKYLDIVKDKHERLIVVSDYCNENLNTSLKSAGSFQEERLVDTAYGILQGLSYLNSKGISHHNLSRNNILLDTEGQIKLSEYGLYHITGYGADVAFPIGVPQYISPEDLCEPPRDEHCDKELEVHSSSGPKTDSWALGIILLEIYTGKDVWSELTMPQIFHKIMSFLVSDIHPFDVIVSSNDMSEKIKSLGNDTTDFLKQCLNPSVGERPSPTELLQHKIFEEHQSKQVPYRNGFRPFSTELRCKHLELPVYGDNDEYDSDHLSRRGKEEVYYLWRLAGGDLEAALRKEGLIKTVPPITLLPCFYTNEGDVFGQGRDKAELLDPTVITLSQQQLRNRLSEIDEKAYYPLLEDEKSNAAGGLPTSPSNSDLTDTASLPLVIKERDVEYQFHRVILYDRLLMGYPYKKPHIWKEARVDIPPLFRSHIWAALLEVEGDIHEYYNSIDKDTPTSTDRQIEVDIPRCHQYHELLSSPTAHAKFKRVLKAWVISHPQYVYWQGLDSLCAPFLALNFNDEALAYACLSAFIPKYLHNFFLKDNSAVIQEYLPVFSHLITFHDPELSNHLDGIGFIPDLYAIPWFLTMYAHVFPLHKIVHLWDTLLLGNSSFPLCIGVAILSQLRDRLLTFGFNECILLFSDMPEIDIQKCVQDSIRIFCGTPKSATYRQHARPAKSKQDKKMNLSYYSKDYHDETPSDLSMEPISVEELKREKCPRISAEDLIELGELRGPAFTKSPTKRKHNSKPMLIVIDVRSPEEFNKGCIHDSINIPFHSAFSPEGDLNPCPAVTSLNSNRMQIKVVVGSRGKNATNFANELARLGYPRVCVLHKGIDVLKQTNLLTVPPSDF